MSITLSTKLATMIACTIPGITLYRSAKGQDNWAVHNTIPACFNWVRYDYKVDQFDSGTDGGPDPQRTPSRLAKAISVMKEAWEYPSSRVQVTSRGDSFTTDQIEFTADNVDWDWFNNDYRVTLPSQEQAPAPAVVPVGVTWAAPEADVVLGTPEIEAMVAVMRGSCQPDAVVLRSTRGENEFTPCDEVPNRFNWFKYDYALQSARDAANLNLDAAVGAIIDASDDLDMTALRAATKHLLALIGE